MRRAQTILEYVVLIACIVGALIAMQVYIKRGMQGRLRQSVDEFGQQYAPGKTTSDFTITYGSQVETKVDTVEMGETGERLKTTTVIDTVYDRQERSGNETVGTMDEPLFY